MNRLLLLSVVVVWTNAASADDAAGVKQTIAFVEKLQTSTGGFLSMPPQPNVRLAPTLRATSAGVRALKYLGAKVPNKEACVKFVDDCWNEELGGFSDLQKGKPDVFTTAVGLMAVKELGMPADKIGPAAVKFLTGNAKGFEEVRITLAGLEALKEKSPKADAWLAEMRKLQNGDGTFGAEGPGQAFGTGGCVVTLLRLGGKVDDASKILAVLKAGQRLNGGYGNHDEEIASDLESTYRVMRCFTMLKERPKNVEGVRSFVAKCRNEDGGYGISPGENSTIAATYFAAIILYWLK